MSQKHKALTLEKHDIAEVFISREYLEKLGLWDMVIEASKTDNFARVYERLIEDALESNDKNLVKMVTGEHIISVNEEGITFEAVPSVNRPQNT